MAQTLAHASIRPHRSSTRGHSDHGWLNTYHSFSFADWFDPRFSQFGALRVLNEDRVRAGTGFPTHPHRDFEIFSYVLSGELTHRDSTMGTAATGPELPSDMFSRIRRGDVQFTTGGTGIAHSELNEHPADPVHFLQIWAVPWARALPPRYHTCHFTDEDKRAGFVQLLSPLRAGPGATLADEVAAEPVVPGTIPVHADLAMAAALVAQGTSKMWVVGTGTAVGTAVAKPSAGRKIFVHLPMTAGGKASVRLAGRQDAVLNEGDGAFVENVQVGDVLAVESIGEAEAEVVLLDTV